MPDKVISATLKVNTGSSASDIGAVNKSLADTTKTLSTTDATAKQTTGSFDTLKDGLGKLPGPMKAVNEGVNTVSTSLKALAANPIVLVVTLLVAALYGLYKAFASTEEGAEKIEQILSGLGAVITVIKDRILQFAGAIVSFFKGDFKEAAEQAKASVTGFADEAVRAYNQVADAVRLLQEAEDNRNRVTNVNRAEFEKNFAKSKELISDVNASYADRKKALEDLRIAQADLSKQELKDAQDILIGKYQLAEADRKDADKQDEYAQAKIDYINAQTQAAADENAINRQGKQIEADRVAKGKEGAAAAQAAHDEKMKQLKEEEDAQKLLLDQQRQINNADIKRINDEMAFRQEQAKVRQEQDAKDQKDRDAYQADIDKKEQDSAYKSIKLANDTAAAKLKIEKETTDKRNAILQSTADALNSLAELIGKNTVAGKAVSIAAATINTFEGASKALAQGGIFGIVSAVAVIAAGLATVRQIAAVKIPGTADSTTAPSISPNIAPAAPIAPQQTGTSIDQSSIAGIGNAVSGRSYVLAQDVTHDQDRNERLNRAARLGG